MQAVSKHFCFSSFLLLTSAADEECHSIRMVNLTTGIIRTVAGIAGGCKSGTGQDLGGPALSSNPDAGTISSPAGLAVSRFVWFVPMVSSKLTHLI